MTAQIKLFQFLLLDNNFPTTNIKQSKSMTKILHQTLPQPLQNPIPVIISQYQKHSKINKGANLANCVRIKRDAPPPPPPPPPIYCQITETYTN